MQTPGQSVEAHQGAPAEKVNKLSKLASDILMRIIRPTSLEAESNLRWAVRKTFPELFDEIQQPDSELWAQDFAYAQQLQNAAQAQAQVALRSTLAQSPTQPVWNGQPQAQATPQYYQPAPASYPEQPVGPAREQTNSVSPVGEALGNEFQQYLASGAAVPGRENV